MHVLYMLLYGTRLPALAGNKIKLIKEADWTEMAAHLQVSSNANIRRRSLRRSQNSRQMETSMNNSGGSFDWRKRPLREMKKPERVDAYNRLVAEIKRLGGDVMDEVVPDNVLSSNLGKRITALRRQLDELDDDAKVVTTPVVPPPKSKEKNNMNSEDRPPRRRWFRSVEGTPPSAPPPARPQTPPNNGLGGNFLTNGGIWQLIVAIAAIAAIIVLTFWAYDKLIDDENDITSDVATSADIEKLRSELLSEFDDRLADAEGVFKEELMALRKEISTANEIQLSRIENQLNDLVRRLDSSQPATSNQTGSNNTNQVSSGSMPNLPHDVSHNGWTIKLADSAVDRGDDPATKWPYEDGMVGRVLERLKAPEPGNWQTAPNVPNTLAPSFDVGAGLEYTGDWNTPFCQQDMRCDFVVPAGSFRYVAGDYGFLDVDNCSGSKDTGYQLWLVNVGDSHIWRNQCADNGGTRHGRFRDGGRLDQGLWGGVSHETANMFNMPTISNANSGEVLNADGDSSNAGANCGVLTENCQFVDILIVIHAGDAIIATAHTVVTHP